jgi:hypothetical protein
MKEQSVVVRAQIQSATDLDLNLCLALTSYMALGKSLLLEPSLQGGFSGLLGGVEIIQVGAQQDDVF